MARRLTTINHPIDQIKRLQVRSLRRSRVTFVILLFLFLLGGGGIFFFWRGGGGAGVGFFFGGRER
ncbi:hypothetical protein BofuT4_uP132340.1 [Botrytis cinerea T4]|uniref:Uncharacterized protein n=1 Tax=Botryotinia fuckeliana (strain T4) TaxID=999810 RepID=G2YR06_BOTF4|nr:hypothetical protein BofuT4_uP132340.1 [Botrytis cinerea T4]